MMGTKTRIFAPCSGLSIEELVPAGQFYRQLERALDLTFVRDLVKDRYQAGGARELIRSSSSSCSSSSSSRACAPSGSS